MCLEAGFEDAQPAAGAAAARLPGTRLLLAKGDAAARRCRFPGRGARPAGLWPHDRWDADYDGDLGSFRILNAVRDALGLVSALGHRDVALVAGHDFGASVAAWCALVRPDVFRSVALMSAPFAGPPALPFDTADNPPQPTPPEHSIHDELAKLDRPRKHYQWYYSTRPANADMWHCPQGVHAFLRGYFHYKSADWAGNKPFPLKSWTAGELAKMPTYYIMDLDKNMAETVAPEMPSADEIASCQWLPENELARLQHRIRAHGLPGRIAVVPRPHRWPLRRRIAAVLRPHDRRAVDLYRRQERLGHLPASRRFRAHAAERLHPHARLPSDRRRRALGAAGATRAGQRAAARVCRSSNDRLPGKGRSAAFERARAGAFRRRPAQLPGSPRSGKASTAQSASSLRARAGPCTSGGCAPSRAPRAAGSSRLRRRARRRFRGGGLPARRG